MTAMDETFGATYIGVVIATFLYGILTLQTYIYWMRYIHDSLFDRLFVVALWMVDTLQLVFICYMQYYYTITNYANPSALAFNDWSFNCEVGLTAVITFMVQIFFARRAWFFTRRVGSRFTATLKTQILGVIIAVITLAQLSFGLASFVMTFKLGQFARFIEYRWLVALWLGSASVCDVLIVYMLSTALVTQRTGFGKTDALIDKLLRYTINTGLLTSIFAIVDLITFCTMNNMIHLGFNFVLGKLYTNTLLATLNARNTEPTNIVHVEESSYNLKERAQASSAHKFSRPQIPTGSQERSEPVIRLQTETAIEVSNEPRRGSPDRYQPHKVLMPGSKKEADYDADSIETREASIKQGKEA
ncbi:hypothetical protein CTheo_5376 [Ceratobasidium theobromae]|uniref:DUF6534 domain-containing protein n=1 Tax=Ceratobasidium theobromae TaxID=1582974 RepID=A0A5N5QIP6_9AGAM|nr:hypothetical protein CTheo_5376 [Ceratobasidium theobromae]